MYIIGASQPSLLLPQELASNRIRVLVAHDSLPPRFLEFKILPLQYGFFLYRSRRRLL